MLDEPAQAGRPGHGVDRTVDERDVAATSGHEMIEGESDAGRGGVGTHVVDVEVWRQRADDDDRLARGGEGVEQLGGDPQRAEDQAVAVAAAEIAEQPELIVGIGTIGGDDEAQPGGAEHVGDGVDHRDVHRVADVGDGEGDLIGAPDLQRAGDGVGDVVELGGGAQHVVAHVVRRRQTVEHAGHRGDRHAGPFGDHHHGRSPPIRHVTPDRAL